MPRSLARYAPTTLLAVLAVTLAVGCSDETTTAVNRPDDTTDTQPPLSPAFDEWSAKDGGPLELAWSENVEADFAGYNIYRYSPDPERLQSYVKITMMPLTVNEYTVVDAQAGVYEYYRVSSVDTNGNESAMSSPVMTSFHFPSDNQPPLIEPNNLP